jgi:alpha-glucosidase
MEEYRTMHALGNLQWWQKAVFYQIYPRSFADGNSDGIGDFRGILAKLDYLRELGIDALWLSPHYPSPLVDCGYDISDYTSVAPEYGNLDLFQEFLAEAHARDIRVILDLVLNHTSDQHDWFLQSRSSRDNPRRDWYIWRDGKGSGPPNNWQSRFGGSAWEFDTVTGQYYYHYFFKEQPDLNWRNPEVKQAMWDVVRFWLDMGVDGYRLDAISTIFEDPELPDHTAGMSLVDVYRGFGDDFFEGDRDDEAQERQHQRALEAFEEMFRYQRELPEVHGLMKELRSVVDAYPDRVLVGESAQVSYYGDGNDELHMAFNFPLMRTYRLTPDWARTNQSERLSALPPGAWPCNTLGNHDAPRVFSRYGDGENDDAIARISLALMLTLRGTPFLYNGEEIGMTDLLLENVEQFRDTVAVWMYGMLVNELGVAPDTALVHAARLSRDKCRTPMQWSHAPNAGFSPTGVQTWLPVNHNYRGGVNVADQERDPRSLLSFYQRLLRVRKQNPALIAGGYTPLHEDATDYLAFLRTNDADGQTCLVVLNMSDQAVDVRFDFGASTARLVFSSHDRSGLDDSAQLALAPFEIVIVDLGSTFDQA